MSSYAFWFSDSDSDDNEENENFQNMRAKRLGIRNNSDPLKLPDGVFKTYFRITKEAFAYLLDILERKMNVQKRSFSVPPAIKLGAVLRFFAEGSYQKGVGNDFNVGLAQPTFSKILKEVLLILESELCTELIKFPDENERHEIKLDFYEKFGFPGVIGCVDGTHVRIISPPQNCQHLYYNRKGYHSLNVMLVCDHKMRIRYVNANNPGASHDSFIWNSSRLEGMLCRERTDGQQNTWLLGDAGYPLKSYLMTPFRAHRETGDNSQEGRFNAVHSRARNVIERTIGVLKNTFRCLLSARELHYTPEKATKIVNVCCALHNLRIKFKIESEPIEVEEETHDTSESNIIDDEDASTIRRSIMNSMNL